MKVSLNWIGDYVDVRVEEKELAHLLTMGGLEVEGVNPVGEGFDKVVVAEIHSIRRHPNADRLSLVEARTARDTFSIVCGATNIREGQRVPLALVGARLTHGMEIKRSKIRGQVSEGMLCSEIELGLGKEASGIMILHPEARLGANLDEVLGLKDVILDISVTPNRPDCLCLIGVAREIAALTHQKVKYPTSSLSGQGTEIRQKTSVNILDPDLCPRYVARMIEGVRIGPSPHWMKDRLEKVGVRSINNVVDVTNYVMMEYGQPLHAFDFERLEQGRIVVRRAEKGESFVTLDGVKRALDEETLMICDGTKPVAVAGVMGGLNSEIGEETHTVLLESAYFHPANNRRTSRMLGLETEASFRFGRGIDYGGCLTVANRAAQLIQELAGGKAVEGAIDAYPAPMKPKPIRLGVQRVYQILGTSIPAKQMKTYLEDLEIHLEEEDDDTLVATPPSFRGDLEREIDLIEEVARLDGFEKIPLTLPKGPPSSGGRNKELVLERMAKNLLVRYGYNEVITYSFTSPDSLDSLGLAQEDPRRKFVRIMNPLTEDVSAMRTSLIPSLMETARYNLSYKNVNVKLFELNKVYLPREGEKLPEEVKQLAGLGMGMEGNLHWTAVQRPIDFYDLKGCIEDLFEELRIKGVMFERAEDVPYLHPGKASRIVLEGRNLGWAGEVHPRVLSHYGMEDKVFVFEIDFSRALQYAEGGRSFRPLPKFPAIYRDLSIVVDDHLEAEKAEEAIRMLRQPLMDEVTLFAVYRGTPIPRGKKSISYRIRYQAQDRTLTDDEVNQHHEKMIARLREILKAELRQ